jgi:hypothetical protein
MYFVPITKDLPLFGRQLTRKWLWTFSLSPGFFGSGIIMGPEIVLHMLTGAIVGWGILSPYAKAKGWAPGDVGDWESGSRGWLIWISLACLMADTAVKMIWIYFRVIWERYGSAISQLQGYVPFWRLRPTERSYGNLLVSSYSDDPLEDEAEDPIVEPEFATTALPKKHKELYGGYLLMVGFIISIPACIFATHGVFGQTMPWFYTFISILLALPVAMTGIRGLAESDFNAGSGLGTYTPMSNSIYSSPSLGD